MRLAHISDLHLGMTGDQLGNGPPSEVVAEAIAHDLSNISEALDLVVVSGDLTEWADIAAFTAFEHMFAETGLPLVVVPGNHDGPAGLRAYNALSKTFAGWNITNRAIEVRGVRFLGLDTCIEGVTEGALEDDGLALVAEEVSRDAPSRLVIVMHHPPLVLGLERFDAFCRLEGRERFMDILGGARDRVTILSGHVHRPYSAVEGNITCFVAGSMVAPYDSPLPFGDHPIRPTALQDFYCVHDLGADGRHVVTIQRVRGLVP